MHVQRQTHALTHDTKHTLSCKNKPHTQKMTIVLKTVWLRCKTYIPVEWDPKIYIFRFMVNWFLTRISSHLMRIKSSPWNKCYCISCVSKCKQTQQHTSTPRSNVDLILFNNMRNTLSLARQRFLNYDIKNTDHKVKTCQIELHQNSALLCFKRHHWEREKKKQWLPSTTQLSDQRHHSEFTQDACSSAQTARDQKGISPELCSHRHMEDDIFVSIGSHMKSSS